MANDTIGVLNFVLTTIFDVYPLPDLSSVQVPYRFKDSVLFTSDVLPLSILPRQYNGMPFKILPQKQICSMLVSDSLLPEVPNFLGVKVFEKSDTGYYVHIQSRSCLPFGGGGTMGLYIGKRNDSFVIQDIRSSSIN